MEESTEKFQKVFELTPSQFATIKELMRLFYLSIEEDEDMIFNLVMQFAKKNRNNQSQQTKEQRDDN